VAGRSCILGQVIEDRRKSDAVMAAILRMNKLEIKESQAACGRG